MNARKMQLITFGIMAGLLAVGLIPTAILAQGQNYSPAQIVDPFTEMLPGVYVASELYNDSGYDSWDSNDWYIEYPTTTWTRTPTTTMEVPGSTILPPDVTWTTEVPTNGTWTTWVTEPYPMPPSPYDPYGYYYYVEDVNGTEYYIYEDYQYSYEYQWDYTNMLVVILLDPDASYIAQLAQQGPAMDIWGIFWGADQSAFSGDEVLIYSSFYYHWSNSSSFYSSNYTWYNNDLVQVDPNEIDLAEEYEWASYMNDSYEYDYQGEYGYYGYDVTEMYTSGNQTNWMEHYFSGMSVFNDTNNNGIMDMVYDDVEYDWNNDGTIDWVSHELNVTASEMVYDFWANDADIGTIVEPFLNTDGQIEWSAEVVDIKGTLSELHYYPIMPCYEYCDVSIMPPIEPQYLDVEVERLEMVNRFEVTDEAAVLKIDQHIGDFSDPLTGGPVSEIQGLGLTLDYWSSFSAYSLVAETYDDGSDEFVEFDTAAPMAAEALNGELQFTEADLLRTTIEFGGSYMWGFDGGTYDVGTAIMPMYFYLMDALPAGAESVQPSAGNAAADSAEYSVAIDYWSMESFYYSSCYANWDGHSITHDPIFMVFPGTAPGVVSDFIDTVLIASMALGAVGLVATTLVIVRIRAAR
ncbi:MAG: hypothetical protein RTU92_06125 [Candidatus Thorarchaeota archaeon]